VLLRQRRVERGLVGLHPAAAFRQVRDVSGRKKVQVSIRSI
jgi:hypothetical protein